MKNIAVTMAVFMLLWACIPSNEVGPLFIKKSTSKNSLVAGLSNNTVIEVSKERQDSILLKKEVSLYLSLPYKDTFIVLVLKSINLFDDKFKIGTDQGTSPIVEKGLFYSGYVYKNDSSTVTLSVNSTDVTGLIYSPSLGMITIARVKDTKVDYLIYTSTGAEPEMSFGCFTKDTMVRASSKAGKMNMTAQAVGPKCVSVDYEMTYENFTYFQGNMQAIVNYITSMALAQNAIYLKEGINVSVKYIYIWTTPDGYNANTGVALTEFVKKRANDPAFVGTFAQLIRGRTGGALSGIAYVGSMCNKSFKFSVAEPLFTWAAYPAYSWSVNVITHELGHNIGSPHTQSCTWQGGPIDNCYPQEGSCAPGPHPPKGGGTIMSYCHLDGTVGINFANGFGPQPHALIINNVALAPCLDCVVTPPPVPTCSDGIKNGDETGIDCGGSCKPCAVTNIALSAKAFQSSEYGGYPAANAIDGKMNTFNHTNAEVAPWLYLDFGSIKDIKNVKVYSRQDCCNGRTRNLKLWAFNDMPPVIGDYNQLNPSYVANGYLQPNQSLDIPINSKARYVKIQCQALNGTTYLHVGELEVYPNGGSVICKDSMVIKSRTVQDTSYIKVCR